MEVHSHVKVTVGIVLSDEEARCLVEVCRRVLEAISPGDKTFPERAFVLSLKSLVDEETLKWRK